MKFSGRSGSIGFSITLLILANFLAIPVKAAGVRGPAITHPKPHVELIELAPLSGDNSSSAAAINDAGEIVGTSSTNSPSSLGGGGGGGRGGGGLATVALHAFVYRRGRISKLCNEPSTATAINDAGQVVGNMYSTNTVVPTGSGFRATFGAVLFGPGAATTLLASTNPSYATGINNQDEIVGHVTVPPVYAFVYQNGVTTFLPGTTNTILVTQMVANGINNQGDIVGYKTITPGYGYYYSQFPFLWHQGQMQDLGTLGGNYATASAVNDVGEVVGWSTTVSNKEVHAFLYQQGQMMDLGGLPGAYSASNIYNLPPGGVLTFSEVGAINVSEAGAINNWGMIVGTALTATGMHAFLYANGTMTDLNSLVRLTRVGRGRGFVALTGATGINDVGQIVGSGEYWDGRQETTRAFLLDLHL